METIKLSVPIQAIVEPAADTFQVVRINLDWENSTIDIALKEYSPGGGGIVSNGKVVNIHYDDAEASNLMRALNTANLSTKSLNKRIIEKLQTDAKLGAGTISGTPD